MLCLAPAPEPMASTAATSYLALVDEHDGATTSTRICETPTTSKEMKTKLKSLKVQEKETRDALKRKVEEEEAEGIASKRWYKRPQWANAEIMEVRLGQEKRTIDVLLVDPWSVVKTAACEAFKVSEKDYILKYHSSLPMTKKVRGKDVPALVGDFSVWSGELSLQKASGSSSSSSFDATSD